MRTIDADQLKEEILDYGMNCGFAWGDTITLKISWILELIDKQPTCGAETEAIDIEGTKSD